MERANRLIDRFQNPLILGFRFLYGLRTVMPFAIGISMVPVLRFVLLNAMGAIVWAAFIGTAFINNIGFSMIAGDPDPPGPADFRRHQRNGPQVTGRIAHEKVNHLLSRQWERLAEIQQIQIELLAEVAALNKNRD